MVRKGEVLELDIESAAFEGSTVARHDDLVIFVRNAVPGDRVRARIRRKKRNYAEASLEEVLQPSPHRIEPRCRYFGACGGCTWQHYDYAQQLESKRRQVSDLFSRIGGLEFPQPAPTLPAPKTYYYRNKMEFTFGVGRWLTRQEIESGRQFPRGFALGMHVPKRFDRLLDLEECFLQSPTSAELVNFMRSLALEQGWSAYDTRRHHGFLRNLVIRMGARTEELLVNLVTSRFEPERMQLVRDRLLEAFPQTTTFVNSINDTHSPVAAGKEIVLHGAGFIHDRIGPYNFRIAPTTFFQPNTEQAEVLFTVARDMAALSGRETVFDLYCGVGSISLFLSESAAQVIGFDNYARSIEQAQENAALNQVANCRFETLDAGEALQSDVLRRHGGPDVAVLDPPRSGFHKDTAAALRESAIRRLVYISCNPATQARDLEILSPRYSIQRIQPVDMFPQTYHIENVVLLERID